MYRAAPGTRRPIYHVGNDAALHGWIHDALLHQPGLVVLHDPSMLDFYAASLTPEAFAAEVRHNYDDVRVARPEREGIDRGDPDPLAVRLERRVVDASLGVIVHSEWAHDEITARCPTASVFHVPLAAPSGPLDRFGPDPRQHFGWSEDDVVSSAPTSQGSSTRPPRGASAADARGADQHDDAEQRAAQVDIPLVNLEQPLPRLHRLGEPEPAAGEVPFRRLDLVRRTSPLGPVWHCASQPAGVAYQGICAVSSGPVTNWKTGPFAVPVVRVGLPVPAEGVQDVLGHHAQVGHRLGLDGALGELPWSGRSWRA